MYYMFIASGDGADGITGNVHLVEWVTDSKTHDVEEVFQEALDHYSRTLPHMGDWTLVTALTIEGKRIKPVDALPPAPESDERSQRAIRAIRARLGEL